MVFDLLYSISVRRKSAQKEIEMQPTESKWRNQPRTYLQRHAYVVVMGRRKVGSGSPGGSPPPQQPCSRRHVPPWLLYLS